MATSHPKTEKRQTGRPRTPFDLAEHHELIYEIHPLYAQAVTLYYRDGMPAPAIANMLGITEGAVWARIQRGRRALQRRQRKARV